MADFDFERPILHNDAQFLADSRTIVTPAQQWALAAEFPIEPSRGERLRVRLLARVDQGSVVIGTQPKAQSGFYDSVVQPAGPFRTIDLDMPPGGGGSILVQNANEVGPSRALLAFLGAEPIPAETLPATTLGPKLGDVLVDPSLFDDLPRFDGLIPGGFVIDWAGTKTRMDYETWSVEIRNVITHDRMLRVDIPYHRELLLDWAPLVLAAKTASDVFRAAALGAGWGRWIAAAGHIARMLGKDYRLLGVEAEPDHFRWIEQHFRDNDIDLERCMLVHGAATGRPGFCYFQTGNPAEWYGQSIRPDSEASRPGVMRVQAVTIEGLIARMPYIDYLMTDIQGAELDFFSCSPELLDDRIRMVNIGTHSLEIEKGLRALFSALEWNCLYDIQLGTTRRVICGEHDNLVPFEDGVQVWVNPKL